jgi:hypothetical protein
MRRLPLLLTGIVLLGGCLHVTLAPIEVHATVDVNVKLEREAASLLGDIYGDSTTIKVPTNPAR